MPYENREFMIFNTSELSKIDFSQVLETSINTVTKSVNLEKAFVKWDGDITPSSIELLNTKEGPYTYLEIKDILSTPEWAPPLPIN